MRLKCIKPGGYVRNVPPQPISAADGEEFDVEDELGKELLQTFPGWFEKVGAKTKPAAVETEAHEAADRARGKAR